MILGTDGCLPCLDLGLEVVSTLMVGVTHLARSSGAHSRGRPPTLSPGEPFPDVDLTLVEPLDVVFELLEAPADGTEACRQGGLGGGDPIAKSVD